MEEDCLFCFSRGLTIEDSSQWHVSYSDIVWMLRITVARSKHQQQTCRKIADLRPRSTMQLCRTIAMVGEVVLAVKCCLLSLGMLFVEGRVELGELARHLNPRRTWLTPKMVRSAT